MKYISVLIFFIMLSALLCGCSSVDTSLQDYTIVYADIDPDEKNILTATSYNEDTDFNLYSAQKLQNLIEEKFGVVLPIKLDKDFSESQLEILVGKTNRTQTALLSLNSLKEKETLVAESNGKLQVCGGSYGATWHAVDSLAQSLESESGAINKQGVRAEYLSKGTCDMTVVACVGDSITWGAESISEKYLSYPAFLQRLLWKDCIVKKYAHSGTTMNDQVEYYGSRWAYAETAEWQQCQNDVQKFDYVLVMLGTNDAWYMQFADEPWAQDYQTKFVESFLRLIGTLNGENDNISYVLMNCPKCFANGYNTYEICKYQQKCEEKATSLGYNVDLFDMSGATESISRLTYAADGLHPNAKGYKIIADIVADMLAEKLNIER